MNKKVITVIVIILVLLLGGYFFMAKGKNGGSGTGPQTSTAASSLKDLISKGIAQSCTFSSEGNKGKVYVAGGKMRGDFESVTDGKTVTNHMIVDNNTSYIWMDGEKTGFKMSFDPSTTKTEGSTTSPASGAFDAGADMNYKCGAWITDGSMFTPPASVTFTSFAVPSAVPATTGSGSSASQCSYCTALTGDDKVQCMSAFNCK